MSSVSRSRAAAWRPKSCAGCKLALGPCRRCFPNTVTYRRDNAVSFRFILCVEFRSGFPGCLVPQRQPPIQVNIGQLFQSVYGVNTPWREGGFGGWLATDEGLAAIPGVSGHFLEFQTRVEIHPQESFAVA